MLMMVLKRMLIAVPSLIGVVIVTFLLTRALPGDPAAYFAVPLGILAATRPNSIIDHLCRVISTAGVSLPVFFTGLILIYVFYYLLGWAPAPLGRLDVFFSPPPHVTGFYLIDSLIAGDGEVFVAALKQLVLPALTLGVFSLAP